MIFKIDEPDSRCTRFAIVALIILAALRDEEELAERDKLIVADGWREKIDLLSKQVYEDVSDGSFLFKWEDLKEYIEPTPDLVGGLLTDAEASPLADEFSVIHTTAQFVDGLPTFRTLINREEGELIIVEVVHDGGDRQMSDVAVRIYDADRRDGAVKRMLDGLIEAQQGVVKEMQALVPFTDHSRGFIN